MTENYDKFILVGIGRFQPVSISYLARVINAPTRPQAIRKDRRFDVKYQLTNEMISTLKQEKESDIEASVKRLLEKGKIYQSVPGDPKRYGIKNKVVVKVKDLQSKFDDDRLTMNEHEYDDVAPEVAKTLKEGFVEIKNKKVNYPKPITFVS
jgi:hypothetical protein